MSSGSESLRDIVSRWQNGDQAAAADLYDRYEQRVLHLAEQEIGPRLRRRISPDDIMVMALHTLLHETVEQTCGFDRNGSLWGLVANIAHNKILSQAGFHTASKRDMRKEVEEASRSRNWISDVPTEGITPEELAQVADELERVRERLSPDSFLIFTLKLTGKSNAEIAERLGVARQTIYRKERRIDAQLQQLFQKYAREP